MSSSKPPSLIPEPVIAELRAFLSGDGGAHSRRWLEQQADRLSYVPAEYRGGQMVRPEVPASTVQFNEGKRYAFAALLEAGGVRDAGLNIRGTHE